MSRSRRAAYAPAFAEAADLNDQLYKALRNSPWWMISIAFHVLLVVVSSIFQTPTAVAAVVPQMHIESAGPPEDPPEEQKKLEPDEIEEVHASDVVAKEPMLRDVEVSDHNETDNDVDFSEPYGDGSGFSDAPWEGPGNNPLIGVGGGGGGSLKGRGGRRLVRKGSGGGRPSEDAVDHALKWLAAHQSPDGGWECEGFPRWCDQKPASGSGPDGKGKAQYDVGVTGLALLAFLGAGITNREPGQYGMVVTNGLRYLKTTQDAEGCFG